MRTWISTMLLGVFLAGSQAGAGNLPQAAILMKELGDSYLSARQYGESLDAYLEALEYVPWYPEVHYNMGAVYLKGFRRYDLAAHHFEMYLTQRENAKDHARVAALVEALKRKAAENDRHPDISQAAIGRRLLLRRPENLRPGQRLEVSVEGVEETVLLHVAVSYPGWVLTEPVPEGSVAEPFLLQDRALAAGR